MRRRSSRPAKRCSRELSPFIWRKYLDFAAVADMHAMKRQIHAYRGHGEIAVEGHNIKLGRGGIREIEFFVQTQQLIAGGRHPELRGRDTLAMLAALADGGWIDAAARDDLAAAYRFLRRVEHRLQMVADEQTHTLPAEREALERFARFLGFHGSRRFRRQFCFPICARCSGTTRNYSKTRRASRRSSSSLSFPADGGRRETLDRLAEWAFASRCEVSAAGAALAGGRLSRAAQRAGARAISPSWCRLLLDHFARSENPDAALHAVRPLPRRLARAAAACCRCCGKIPISSR